MGPSNCLFSNLWKLKVSRTVVSNSAIPWTVACPVLYPWNSPSQSTGVGSLFLLQGIFPTQGLNPGFPHCRRILYQLSHQGRPWMANGISDLTWPALSSDFHWAPSQAGNGST